MSKLLVVGGGTMGRICAQAAVAELGADRVVVLERTAAHAALIQTDLGVTCVTALTPDLGDFTMVVLAVKPQDAVAAITPLRPVFTQALVISVMAGVSTARLSELTGSARIARCMPNTPAKIGRGMTAWTATPHVTAADREFITNWLNQFGETLWVESDDWIDRVTAVSASGPGYVFAFAADLVSSAKTLGFTDEQANLLVQQTLLGAAELWKSSSVTPVELRDQVTSKGGTTAAALTVLADAQMSVIWQKAVQAAYDRAKALQNLNAEQNHD